MRKVPHQKKNAHYHPKKRGAPAPNPSAVRATGAELRGRFQATSRGFGFLIPEAGGEDWFIPPGETGGAWDGDTVTARPLSGQDGSRSAARVTSILTRGNQTVTGRIAKRGRQLWLLPDRDRLPTEILLSGKPKGFGPGDKAAVNMLSFGTRTTPPMAAAAQSFGKADSREAAVQAILFNYNISVAFPAEVQAAADASPQDVPPEALEGRLDLRDELIITIDGASAKDLDDAVSFAVNPDGTRVLGVHIADVSHYVPAGGALDREAFERGTSVYFADRVAPMLPPALSNGICSLHPRVDRLTLSCIMTIDAGGTVISHRLARSVIRTAERMTYEDCNVLLDDTAANRGELETRYAHVLPLLRGLNALAHTLTKKRRGRGSLMLETAESAFVMNALGEPVDIVRRGSGPSESLIEECMVLANETVAAHLRSGKSPGVFRIHEKPSAEKTEALRAMLAPLGYELKAADGHALQKILDAADGKPEAYAVRMMVLRSLMKARYEPENLGHFGLGAADYCHFTSPIRRYPDLIVHRVLTALLTNPGGLQKLSKFTPRAAEESSRRELAATNAEREIEKLYMAEYMVDKIGQTFSAVVSGVAKFGLFVMLESGVEGMIPAIDLPGGRYNYDETRLTLTSAQGAHCFTFGMALEVTCTAAAPATGEVAFQITDNR